MIIKRKLFAEIEKYIEQKQAIVVTGMRRVGKTTLLRYLFEKIPSKNKIFLDLEDPFNQAIFEETNYEKIKEFFHLKGVNFNQKSYLFLDEIQLVKNIPSVVKYFLDHYQVKFFLSGSASFYLKNLFSQSLAGRKFVFELYPLDFEEFLWFKAVKVFLPKFKQSITTSIYHLFSPYLHEFLSFGTMPEVVLTKNAEEKEMILKDIFASYYQKEILALGDFRKNQVIRNLILLLTKRVGQKIDIQRLASELQISRETVYQYLDFLQQTYLISLLPAIGRADTMIRKQKKLYFVDNGFLSIEEKPVLGPLFENAVFNQLKIITDKLFYFEKNKSEIDFIIKTKKGEKIAFEVKETAVVYDINKLAKIAEKLGIKKYFVISLNYCNHPKVKYLFQLGNDFNL
jgi:predicted AAA+ superfamily ATPase